MALSKTTQDHDEIQKWAEKRGAKPAEVKSTHSKNEPGILRFCFPDAPNHNNDSLREISWDEFFEKFDENGLELIYQERTAEGAESNFNKLIYPEDEHHSKNKASSHSGSHTTSGKSSSQKSGSSSHASGTSTHASGSSSHKSGSSSHSSKGSGHESGSSKSSESSTHSKSSGHSSGSKSSHSSSKKSKAA